MSLSSDGRVAGQGDLSSALANDKALQKELSKEQQAIENDKDTIDEPVPEADTSKDPSSGKLIVEEEVAIGQLSWSARTWYIFNHLRPVFDSHLL